MGIEIAELANDVPRECCIRDGRIAWCGCGGGRRIGNVCDQQASQHPVVAAILEDVEGGHGGIAEAVDEDGFEFAFEEVEGDHETGQCLEG